MVSSRTFSTCVRVFFIMCVATLLTGVNSKPTHHKARTLTECDRVSAVSMICYNCANFYPDEFQAVHSKCCSGDQEVRRHCESWYSEDPKRGW